MPKRVKHRKVQRGDIGGLSQRCNKLDFGDYGLQSLDRVQLTANQIEAARVAITRHMKRHGKVWIRSSPTSPTPRSPRDSNGQRQGQRGVLGRPRPPGRVLFEISGCPETIAKEAMSLAAAKLPIRCKFIARRVAV
jgi:large subunit ribosomal protein L16